MTHNNPPSAIDFAGEATKALSDWMAEHPVVQTEDEAREVKLLVDRAQDTFKDMERERTDRVGPLNKQVKDINDEYRGPRTVLENVLNEILVRLEAFRKAEEDKRLEAARIARGAAEAAERAARLAEEREQQAKSDAAAGELGIDIGSATESADKAFSRFQKAQRDALRAERDSTVKIGGGFRKALAARTKETLVVDNWQDAIAFMGLTDGIRDAILTAARAYRQEFDELPIGITSTKERSL